MLDSPWWKEATVVLTLKSSPRLDQGRRQPCPQIPVPDGQLVRAARCMPFPSAFLGPAGSGLSVSLVRGQWKEVVQRAGECSSHLTSFTCSPVLGRLLCLPHLLSASPCSSHGSGRHSTGVHLLHMGSTSLQTCALLRGFER